MGERITKILCRESKNRGRKEKKSLLGTSEGEKWDRESMRRIKLRLGEKVGKQGSRGNIRDWEKRKHRASNCSIYMQINSSHG